MSLVSNLNDSQLVRLVDDHEFLMWGIEGNYHIINTRHFAMRIEVSEMEENDDAWELGEYLRGVFKKEPVYGQTLVMQHGEIQEGKHHAKQLHDKFMTNIPTTEGTVTPFIYAVDDFRYRWVKFNDFNLFINDDFASLLYYSAGEKAYAEDSQSPLFLCDGDLFILPITNKSGKVKYEGFEEFSEMLKLEGFARSATESTEPPSEAAAV